LTNRELIELLRHDVVLAAKSLLGSTLSRGARTAVIVETEAYRGEDDPACHAFGKVTMKNMVLFEEPGLTYIYLNYGVHWMLNISAHEAGRAAGVLIRSAKPVSGIEEMRALRMVRNARNLADIELLNGPGKLAQAFGITFADNRKPILSGPNDLVLTAPVSTIEGVESGPRVGIAVGKGHETPWRFFVREEAEWVSRPNHPFGK
jgi:DNA-3-methyladenine glycosylase